MGNASRTRTSQDTAGTQENRAKALQSAITATEKAFGKGAIMRLGDNHGMAVERIPTGPLGLDIVIGRDLPVAASPKLGSGVEPLPV
ncbi:Recombinase A [Serratia ficaria]|uniref:DNA recombination/repair protein RecA n=1 Tax=Serratia ficaria TaxID=61651 RepID=UPI00217AD2E4|nr:DNA recombination/repair protein RecA [Serratia ficaria]CAI2156641.1 Recombinase A [Serratia ficaria]CAI2535798.1 Recombinase A [Serratia ficaria]